MLEMIRSLAGQLSWAGDLEVPPLPGADEILVAGMGGSGIAGDYLGALAHTGPGRVVVHKGYAPLPGWVRRVRPLVVAVSYSGNTEETLDTVEAARREGLPVVAVTTGGSLAALAADHDWPLVQVPAGLQPRAALGYLVGAVARLAANAGVLPDQAGPLAEAAATAATETTEGSESWSRAEETAGRLAGRIPIVYGGGPVGATVAQRWKTQINENAKRPAWWSVLPELDHNELVGWEAMPLGAGELLAVVALRDRADHRRVGSRFEHSRALTEDAVPWVSEVHSRGESILARLVSLTVVGDLASWMLAESAGVDPVPVDTIEELKRLLAEE